MRFVKIGAEDRRWRMENRPEVRMAERSATRHRHDGKVIHKIRDIDVPESAATGTERRACKACGSLQNCDFRVLDDVWKAAVPAGYRDARICLNCFEVFTSEKQIELLQGNGGENARDPSPKSRL
jgi:hypothetical protein